MIINAMNNWFFSHHKYSIINQFDRFKMTTTTNDMIIIITSLTKWIDFSFPLKKCKLKKIT